MPASSFVTEGGLYVPAVSLDQMREIDRIAIEETGPNLFQMMENAGRALATVVMETIAPRPDSAVLVLAGTGGNGGGGICGARHLANHGVRVTLVVSNIDGLGPVPRQQLTIFAETDGVVAGAGDLDRIEPELIVDALVGYSLHGAPTGEVRRLIEWAAQSLAPVISLDVPSGIHADSGDAPGAHVAAVQTVTLALPKTGLDVAVVGTLTLADIGIPAGVYRRVGLVVPEAVFGHGYRTNLRPSGSHPDDPRPLAEGPSPT